MSEMSEKPKFTPRPWRAVDVGYGFRIEPDVCWIGENSNVTKKQRIANKDLIVSAPEMYSALKMVCEDCEKLSNWEDMFNIGRPEGSIMPKCPCDGCYVKEALMKANGEAFLEVKKRRRIADIAFEMYELLDKCESCIGNLLYGTVDDPVFSEAENTIHEIQELLKKARGEE